jgi:hypothetical protein
MLMSMTLPLVQLIILGNAFGGKVTNARMGVVDYDNGEEALKDPRSLPVRRRQHPDLHRTVTYNDEQSRAKMCAPARSTERSSSLRSIRAASSPAIPPHRPGRR